MAKSPEMSVKTALAVLALILLLPSPSAAAAAPSAAFIARCERDLAPQVDVEWKIFGYDVTNTVSSRVLNTKAVHGYPGEFTLGLTAMRSRAEISLSAPSLTDAASGQECLAPRVSVELLLPRMDVFVARELPATSCPFRAVMEHEMQHVKVYEEALPLLADTLRARIHARFARGPLYAPAGTGMARLDEDVDRWLRPMIQAELLRVEQRQRLIDSDEESFRLSGVCGGELSARMAGRQ